MKQQLPLAFGLLSLFAASILLSSCAGQNELPGRSFEGTITQTIRLQGLGEMLQAQNDTTHTRTSDSAAGNSDNSGELANGNMPGFLGAVASAITMKIYVRQDKVAYEVEALGGLLKMRTIIDRTSRTLTMLLPMHQAVVTNLKAMDTMRTKIDDSIKAHQSSLDSMTAEMPQPTGKKATINGLQCEEYRGTVHGMDVDMWLTTDPRMKFYDVVRDAFLGRNRTGAGGIEQLFNIIAPISGGKVPVKVEMSSHGKVMVSSELSNITEGKVDDAMFEIPKDYEIVNHDSVQFGSSKSKLESPSANGDSKPDTTNK